MPPDGVFYEGDETDYRYEASFGDAAAARVRNLNGIEIDPETLD